MREQVSAQLVRSAHKSRDITNAGPLDPDAFWPFADTIGGSLAWVSVAVREIGDHRYLIRAILEVNFFVSFLFAR